MPKFDSWQGHREIYISRDIIELMSKIGVIIALAALFLIAFAGAVDTDIVEFRANILANEPQIVKVSVPDYVFLGSVGKGEQTENVKIYVNNTGNVNVTITPELVNKNDPYFKYIYFQRRVAEPYRKIGEFKFNISAPKSPKKYEDEYVYAKLDLRSFEGDIQENIQEYKSDVKFVAVAQ